MTTGRLSQKLFKTLVFLEWGGVYLRLACAIMYQTMKNIKTDNQGSVGHPYAPPQMSLISYDVTRDWCTTSTLVDWEEGKYIVDGI